MRLPAHPRRRGSTEADTDDETGGSPVYREGTETDIDDRLPAHLGYRAGTEADIYQTTDSPGS